MQVGNMPQYLYRGVNPDLYHSMGGKLTPKACGEAFKRHVYFGEKVYFGGGATYGESEANAVIMHQTDSSEYPTSGVSTTPVYENAVRYATHDGKHTSGYVFKIDTTLLNDHGVTAHPVDQHARKPTIPEDEEVILVVSGFGTLPDGIIVEVIAV